MLVTPSSVTKVWARTQHAPLYAVMRTAVRLHLWNQKMHLPTVSFVYFRRTWYGNILSPVTESPLAPPSIHTKTIWHKTSDLKRFLPKTVITDVQTNAPVHISDNNSDKYRCTIPARVKKVLLLQQSMLLYNHTHLMIDEMCWNLSCNTIVYLDISNFFLSPQKIVKV